MLNKIYKTQPQKVLKHGLQNLRGCDYSTDELRNKLTISVILLLCTIKHSSTSEWTVSEEMWDFRQIDLGYGDFLIRMPPSRSLS